MMHFAKCSRKRVLILERCEVQYGEKAVRKCKLCYIKITKTNLILLKYKLFLNNKFFIPHETKRVLTLEIFEITIWWKTVKKCKKTVKLALRY